MRVLLIVLITVPLFAQDPAATPAPAAENWLTGLIDLGYQWRTDVAGSFETYRSVVNLGSGPKLLSTEFTLLDPEKRLFDRIAVRAYDWGGDPYSTLHVNATKTALYDFNVDYRNIAYFNNLPSFSDPLLSRGIVLDERALDTRRRLASVQLDLLPGNWLIPYLAFDRDSDTGNGVNAFVAGGNEYGVPMRVRNNANEYRGGVRLEMKKFHITLEQGGTTYKDDQNSYVSTGGTNYGNNATPLLGAVLDLTSLSQAYGIRGSSVYSKGLLTASVASWLDVYGQFLYSQPSNSVTYQQNETGSLAIPNQLLFFTGEQYLLSAEAKLPHTAGSFGAEVRPFRRFRILQSWLTDRLHSSSSAGAQQTIAPSAVSPLTSTLLNSALAANYSQEQVDLLLDVTPRLSVHAGYRYVWGESSDVILPLGGLSGLERGTLSRNVGIGGITYRPRHNFSVTGDVEGGASTGIYFRTSLYDYQKLRINARYQITSALHIAADFHLLNNQNPNAGVQYDYLAHQESVSLNWLPNAKSWDLQASYTRSTLRSEINYRDPGTLQPQTDFYRDNSHSATLLVDARLPSPFGMTPKAALGGSLVISSGSRPTSYYQPIAKLTMPLRKNLAWVSEWRYYGFGENFYLYEDFRAHLVTTGLRFTR